MRKSMFPNKKLQTLQSKRALGDNKNDDGRSRERSGLQTPHKKGVAALQSPIGKAALWSIFRLDIRCGPPRVYFGKNKEIFFEKNLIKCFWQNYCSKNKKHDLRKWRKCFRKMRNFWEKSLYKSCCSKNWEKRKKKTAWLGQAPPFPAGSLPRYCTNEILGRSACNFGLIQPSLSGGYSYYQTYPKWWKPSLKAYKRQLPPPFKSTPSLERRKVFKM